MMAREELPENAKLVFKGQVFDVYQWEQRIFDGSTKTFEMLKRPNTVQVLATVGEKIVFLDQEQPGKGRYVSLPGGWVGQNEDELVAAKRELLEETGLVSDNWSMWKRFQPMIKVVFDVVIFLALDCTKTSNQNLDGGERINVNYLTIDELLELTDDREAFKQPELAMVFMDMRLHPEKKETFRKLLWG